MGETRKNPRKSKLRSFLIWLAALLAIAVIFLALPIFHLQEFIFSDTVSISEQDIVNHSGLQQGQHLAKGLGGSLRHFFELRYGGAENQITDSMPYVKSAVVKMSFPGKISINVEERTEVAYVAIPDGCVLIDKDGYALDIKSELPSDIPVIEGIRVVSLNLGQELTVDVTSAMQIAVTLMGAIIDADRDERPQISLMEQVRIIRPAGGNLIYVTIELPQTKEEMIVLAERGSSLTEDMLWLRFAIEQEVLSGHGKGILDMTGQKKIFRPDAE